MEEKVSVWKANLTGGIILSLIGIAYSLIGYFAGLTFNKAFGYLLIPIQFLVLYFLMKSYRDNVLHGFISYGDSVGSGVVIFLYYSIITAVFVYILYKVIDPGLVAKQIAMAEDAMAKKGLPQESIDAGMAITKKFMRPEFTAPISILFNMIWGTILSLIASIFIRNEGNPLLDIPENQ
jgi:FtsH-binding integral membrane protein